MPQVSARSRFRLKNQEAPFLIEAMTIPAPAMKMIVPRTGEIGIRSLVSATASNWPNVEDLLFLGKGDVRKNKS